MSSFIDNISMYLCSFMFNMPMYFICNTNVFIRSIRKGGSSSSSVMFAKKSKRIWMLYVIFAVYVTLVMVFLGSMLLRSTVKNTLRAKGLPRYMSDVEISEVKILEDRPLDQQLKLAFDKSDSDHNGYLEEHELFDWIQSKISEHITLGVKSNLKVFLLLDKAPKDGWVSLKEYETVFLSSRGVQNESDLPRAMKEQFSLERAEFYEVGGEPERLSIDQLLRFRHPECSHSSLLERVDELVDTLDQDGDAALSLEELLQLSDPLYQPSDEEAATFPVESSDKMKALHRQLDLDANGQLNQHELLVFIDPRHSYHASGDARRLLQLGDGDGDGRLSLPEVRRHPDQFRLLVDARHKFHQPEDRR